MGTYTTVRSPGFGDVQFKYGGDGCFWYDLGDELTKDPECADGIYEGLADETVPDGLRMYVDVEVTVKDRRIAKLRLIRSPGYWAVVCP